MIQEPRSLDEIMSREPVTETAQPNEPANTGASDGQGQTRDDHGKFTTKQPDPAAEVNADPDNAAQTAVEGGEGKGKVPIQAVHAAREKARTEGERADALERQLAELRGQVSVLTQQRPAQAQPVEQPKPKAFWEDPDAFLAERTAPIQQEAVKRHFMTSRMLADDKFGPDTVKEADDALGVLMQANPNDPEIIALSQRVQNSAHPYADMVTWHQRRKAMADIGEDPAAYRERVRAELQAELSAANPATATPAAPAARTPLPSNFAGARSEGPRSSVTYSGPKPLSEITKGSAQ